MTGLLPTYTEPGRRTDPGSAKAATARRAPAWSIVLQGLHGSTLHPAAFLADALVIYIAAESVGVGARRGLALAAAMVIAFHVTGVYDHRDPVRTRGVAWYPKRVVAPVAVVAIGLAASSPLSTTARQAADFAVASVVALVALRCVTWWVLVSARRARRGLLPAAVLGAGPNADLVERKLREYPEAGLEPVRVLPLSRTRDIESIRDAVRDEGIRHVVVAPEVGDDVLLASLLQACSGLGISFSLVPPLADLFLHPGAVNHVGGVPIMPVARPGHRRGRSAAKRAFDLAVSAAMLAVLSPVLALTALAIKLDDGGPVFYRQSRTGHRSRKFDMLKFRSMVVDADQRQAELRALNVTNGLLFKLDRDPRVTRVGRFIRRTSIDELPQLINVLRGHMSLVGPRPLPVEPTQFGPIERARHNVLPGITGVWQVSGGNALTYEEMVKLDLAYLHNRSLWLDIQLLVATIPALLHRRGPA